MVGSSSDPPRRKVGEALVRVLRGHLDVRGAHDGLAVLGLGGPTRDGGSGCVAGTRTVAVVRRTRSVVLTAAFRVAVTMLAIDAPVSSSTPASIRNTHRMCEPAVEKNLAEAQKSDSPTRPPWCCR